MFKRIRVEKGMNFRRRSVVLCGLAGFALAGFALTTAAAAKDIALNTAVDVETTVSGVHQVSAGNFPGLHLDASVKGRAMDVYISPMDFASKYGVKVAKGDYVHIVGTEMKSGDASVVVARSITTGSVDKRTGTFREDMTIYLQNDAGPLWQ